jgi:hypothetical protein
MKVVRIELSWAFKACKHTITNTISSFSLINSILISFTRRSLWQFTHTRKILFLCGKPVEFVASVAYVFVLFMHYKKTLCCVVLCCCCCRLSLFSLSHTQVWCIHIIFFIFLISLNSSSKAFNISLLLSWFNFIFFFLSRHSASSSTTICYYGAIKKSQV